MKIKHLALIAIAMGLLALGGIAAADGSGDPASALHDPLTSPTAAYSDLQSAQHLGWPLAILAGAVILSRLLGRAGGIFSPLAKPKVALVIGTAGALVTASYNALALGGSWLAVAMAGLVAAASAWDAMGHKQVQS